VSSPIPTPSDRIPTPSEFVLEYHDFEEERAMRVNVLRQFETATLSASLACKGRPNDRKARADYDALIVQLVTLKRDYKEWLRFSAEQVMQDDEQSSASALTTQRREGNARDETVVTPYDDPPLTPFEGAKVTDDEG
jgi:hypothetical protein